MQALSQGAGAAGHADAAALVRGNTEFALDLYRRLQSTDGNLFFSPYSISTALGMTYAGARGDTARQIAQALRFPPGAMQVHAAFAALGAVMAGVAQKGEVQLAVANSLWPHQRFAPLAAFLELTRQYYGVAITSLDYGETEAARGVINGWVVEQTSGKITDLIPKGVLDALSELVLVNAIYFKGNWATEFDPAVTHPAPFWVTPQIQVRAPSMYQEHDFVYGENAVAQLLELPYAGDDVSMLVLLPRDPGALAALEASLTAENLSRWTRDMWETEVQVLLPRFKFSLAFRLDSILQSMGMVDAFSSNADFSGIAESRLGISAILHKAHVAVDEEGAEAAAATAVVLARGMMSAPPSFRADHPFLFLIRETNTGSILFLGRVVDPTVETRQL